MAIKLQIELVPATSWYTNLRKVLPSSEWDKVRRKAYADYDHKCGICGARGKLNCHEMWEYDDAKHVQKLKGFIALCDMCHHVKHIGLAGILSKRGQLDFSKVIEHFIKVNGCDIKVFERHHAEAFRQWKERSKHNWNVDIGEYSVYLKKMKD